jgi:protein TonB
MKSKKSQHANIEKKRNAYFQVGLVCALALVLIGLEWTIFTKESKSETRVNMNEEVMIIPPNVIIEEPKTENKPKEEKSDEIEIDDDDSDDEEKEKEVIKDDSDKESIALDTTGITVIEGIKTPKPPIEVLTIADVMPEFPTGMDKLKPYLRANVGIPEEAKVEKSKGTVYVKFIVEPDGAITNVHCMKGKKGPVGGGCEEEAMRVVSKMPNWKPGEHMGHKVRVERIIPIKFTVY